MTSLRFLSFLVLLACPTALYAVEYDLSWSRVAGGGATFMAGANFRLGGTAGQCDAGALSGASFDVYGGFWGARNVAVGTPDDLDGDGFPNELETALGTNPLDPASTPFGGDPAGDPQALGLTKTTVKLNFVKTAKDAIHVSGSLPVPAAFVVEGQVAVLYVGGVTRSFTLDKKGKGPKGVDAFAIKIKAKKGVVAAQSAKFTATFAKGTFAASLADEGLDGSVSVKKASRGVVVIVLFDRALFQTTKTLSYTATQGKKGSAK